MLTHLSIWSILLLRGGAHFRVAMYLHHVAQWGADTLDTGTAPAAGKDVATQSGFVYSVSPSPSHSSRAMIRPDLDAYCHTASLLQFRSKIVSTFAKNTTTLGNKLSAKCL